MENVNYLMKHFSFQGEESQFNKLKNPQSPSRGRLMLDYLWIVGMQTLQAP